VHIHIAIWAIALAGQSLEGRTGEYHSSTLVSFLEALFGGCRVDVQLGSGWLNYINGYTGKANDAMDFRIKEHYKNEKDNAAWRQTYRLLCKKAPLLTEVYLAMKKRPLMYRTFLTDILCPVIPGKVVLNAPKATRHHKMYAAYLKKGSDFFCSDGRQARPLPLARAGLQKSLLEFCRAHSWNETTQKPQPRSYKTTKATDCCVGVKFEFELYDIFVGQFAVTMFPHASEDAFSVPIDRDAFHGPAWADLEYTKHFVGVLSYLLRLRWAMGRVDCVLLETTKLNRSSFPMDGFPDRPENAGLDGNTDLVFALPRDACSYLIACMHHDLSMRYSQARCSTFRWHMSAKWDLLRHLSRAEPVAVQAAVIDWNYVPTKTVREPPWSDDQIRALNAIGSRLDDDDPLHERAVDKPIYLGGDPGTGKSEILVHSAIRAAEDGKKVLIMCPTGTLVFAYRERIPTHPHIVIETIHSATVIVRVNDAVVMYAPPTRLRRYDLILIDEGSQIEDAIAIRLRLALSELQHPPLLVLAADYRQLQPIEGGCEVLNWCLEMDAYYLTECHRTDDPELLAFLKTVRKDQPSRAVLEEFFRYRHLPTDLKCAVACGLELQKRRGQHFIWLCVTNKGANRVNAMALELEGVTGEDLLWGYSGDPNASAGTMFIKKGLWLRLTRNLDKSRGFVNGALGQVVELLSSNSRGVTTFIVKLTTGAMVLVHPIRIGDDFFLPCCYGYATTIRRAQGSSLHLGALYFDHSYPADPGYGYVGIKGSSVI